MMKIAAIDIGSNAIRLQVIRVTVNNKKTKFKDLEYIRFPLRLGQDVFSLGHLSNDTILNLYKLMETFKNFMDLYQIDDHIANATSAMREAKNGDEIVEYINRHIGIKLEIIDGKKEAEILSKAIIPFLKEKNYLHIDVGGGSTELNIYVKQKKIKSKSFELGTVRTLSSKKKSDTFKTIEAWLKKSTKGIDGSFKCVGTGGNINKLYKLAKNKSKGTFSLTELKAITAYLNAFDYDQKISMLNLNPDRADVIIPASEIYVKIMEMMSSDSMKVPGVGLKDGLLSVLYEKVSKIPLKSIEFLGAD